MSTDTLPLPPADAPPAAEGPTALAAPAPDAEASPFSDAPSASERAPTPRTAVQDDRMTGREIALSIVLVLTGLAVTALTLYFYLTVA